MKAEGGADARIIGQGIGLPELDALSLLLRETAQNSWDARLRDGQPVSYSISLYSAQEPQRRLLQEHIFADLPPREWATTEALQTALRRRHSGQGLRLLVISDRGTRGLAGPTRADRPPAPGEPNDFVQLLRSIGQAKEVKVDTAGSYGVGGKSVLFNASLCRTILVHTHCLQGDRVESRLIAAAAGDGFTARSAKAATRYTGRHWWGVLEDRIAEPLTGRPADNLAARLGLPPFADGVTGTNIAVVEPFVEDDDAGRLMETLAESILAYFWPQTVEIPRHPSPMQFQLFLDHNEYPLKNREDYPALAGFERALRLVQERGFGRSAADEVHTIETQRPRATVGTLALTKFARRPRPGETAKSEIVPFADVAKHVAMMRQPLFVVKYLSGPPFYDADVEYAGVFKVHRSQEELFKRTETPAHNDWVPTYLPRAEQTIVNAAKKKSEAILKDFVGGAFDDPESETRSLPLLSLYLGGLLIGDEGDGPSPTVPPAVPAHDNKTPKKGPQARIIVDEPPALTVANGEPRVSIPFRLVHASESRATSVRYVGDVVVDRGDREREPPDGALQSAVIEWIDPTGTRLEAANPIVLTLEGPYTCLASAPPQIVLRPSFHAEPIAEEGP